MIKCFGVGMYIVMGKVVGETDDRVVLEKAAAVLPNALMMLAPGAEKDELTVYKAQIAFEFTPSKEQIAAYEDLCTKYAAQSAGLVLPSQPTPTPTTEKVVPFKKS
jgi:hypothetical protein